MTKYVVNAVSLNMFRLPEKGETQISLLVKPLTTSEFCSELGDAVSAVGHASTVELINRVCGSNISVSRVSVSLSSSDELVVVQVLKRLPEGKVLDYSEVKEMLEQGMIKFYKVVVTVSE